MASSKDQAKHPKHNIKPTRKRFQTAASKIDSSGVDFIMDVFEVFKIFLRILFNFLESEKVFSSFTVSTEESLDLFVFSLLLQFLWP